MMKEGTHHYYDSNLDLKILEVENFTVKEFSAEIFSG